MFLNLSSYLVHTFTSSGGDLSERVVTAVTLSTYDSSLAGALARYGVTGPRLRANREAFTGVTSVIPLWTVVVILQERRKISIKKQLRRKSDMTMRSSMNASLQ